MIKLALVFLLQRLEHSKVHKYIVSFKVSNINVYKASYIYVYKNTVVHIIWTYKINNYCA